MSNYLSLVIRECLTAVVNGPFIVDNEFSTLFGLNRDEVNKVLLQWPNLDMRDLTVQLAINNSLNTLIGYPIDHSDRWSEYLSVSKEQLSRIFKQWRVDIYGPEGD
jgi:hypothetical protein